MGQGCCSFETSIISEVNDKMVMIQDNEKTLKTLKSSSTPESADEVGFSSITKQLKRKVTRKGFKFKLMVVGETGLGKSTFINTLFLTDIYNDFPKIIQTLKIETKHVNLEENGVKLHLTIVDTPGYPVL
jgi:predicted GTPase